MYSIGINNSFCLENVTKVVNFTIYCNATGFPSAEWFYGDGNSLNKLVRRKFLKIDDGEFVDNGVLQFGPTSLLEISNNLFSVTSEDISFKITCTVINEFGSDNATIEIYQCGKTYIIAQLKKYFINFK